MKLELTKTHEIADDGCAYVWTIEGGRSIRVEVAGSVRAHERELLPSQVARAVETKGESAVRMYMPAPPPVIVVGTEGIARLAAEL